MESLRPTALHHIIDAHVREHGHRPAVVDHDAPEALTYAHLGELSNRLRDRLVAWGVSPGDRVGIYLRKSADGVASIFGILKAGAAYVPVDPLAPASRDAYIHHDCGVKVAIVESCFLASYVAEFEKLGPPPKLLVIESVGGALGLRAALDAEDAASVAPAARTVDSAPGDLAYVLYTSGSTGKPKGVMLSHENATAFVYWCVETFGPTRNDVFSSHAPFHFDLSIFDLYVSLAVGGSVVIVPEDVGKEPQGLAQLIAKRKITIWYSAPTTLSLLAQFGKIATHDFSSLRAVLFAGEVFPIVHLRSFKSQVPEPRYFNLYGPTETNVCTYYEIPAHIPEDRADPYPIGKVCSNLEGKVVDTDGAIVARGAEGELCIAGPNVMQGYWGLPELTAKGFLVEPGNGKRWYKTGDLVVEEPGGDFRYVGRRDRMVKKRGYRIELGEIEACLYRHPAVREAAVVALTDADGNVKVKAHLSVTTEKRPSLIELKTFCSKHLPVYMVPDAFGFHDALPKTSTDKTDYQTLKNSN